jgi:hypothetical protein
MNLARFTTLGLDAFDSYLDELETNPTAPLPPTLLTSPQNVKTIDDEIELVSYKFASRWEAARYLESLFRSSGITAVENDVHLWAHLTAVYFDGVCPPRADGRRQPRERARYIPEPGNYRRYYRHSLLGPYLIYRAHLPRPERAMAMLCGPLHVISDIEAQIAARQQYVTNVAVVQLATDLYYDVRTRAQKSGAGGKGPGSPRRLADILNQFDLTRDLYATTTDELRRLLPGEFKRFLT